MNESKKIYTIAIILLLIPIIVPLGLFLFHEDTHVEAGTTVEDIIVTEQQANNSIAVEIAIKQSNIELIAKTVYGEARGCSIIEQSAVIWCILNRVDAGYGSIEQVITKPYQFTGYKESNPVKGEFVELAKDVLVRWQAEKYCIGDVGRTLPNEYLWFYGDGKVNHFRNKYSGDYNIWDWNCLNPYP